MKNDFKGTQGEWEFYPITEESNGYINIEIPMGTITVYNRTFPYIMSEDKEKCVEILEANAKLIACAPKMLFKHEQEIEILEKVLEQLGELGSYLATDLEELIESKRQLIKKAT